MNNYHYIIAGLPDLLPDFTQSGHFSYGEISAAVREQLSTADRRAVDWLEFGSDTSHLSPEQASLQGRRPAEKHIHPLLVRAGPQDPQLADQVSGREGGH